MILQIAFTYSKMKSTKVQNLGAPTRMRSIAQNNYLLLGVVTQHAKSKSIGEVQKDRLERESSLLPPILTHVFSRAELTISPFSVRRSNYRRKYAVGLLTLVQYVK